MYHTNVSYKCIVQMYEQKGIKGSASPVSPQSITGKQRVNNKE